MHIVSYCGKGNTRTDGVFLMEGLNLDSHKFVELAAAQCTLVPA